MKGRSMTRVGKRMLAWCLAVAMVLTGIWLPEQQKTAAAATTVSNATNSSNPVYVEFEQDAKNSTGSYNQYNVKIHNNSSSTISDWAITIKFSGNPGWNAGWNGASYDSSTQTATIQTYGESTWNNATIYAGDIGSGAGFQVAAGALNNAAVTLTYENGESSGGPATGGTSTGGSTSGGDVTIESTWDVEDENVLLSYTAEDLYDSFTEYKFVLENQGSSRVSGNLVITFDKGRQKNWWTEDYSIGLNSNVLTISNLSVDPKRSAGPIQVQLKPLGAKITCVTFAGKKIAIGKSKGGTEAGELKYELTGQTKNLDFSETPVGKHGKLSLQEVAGYKTPVIVDKNGQPFQLRGASTHGMHWDEMHPFVNKASFQSLRDEWGVNMVRLVSYITQGGYTDGKQSLLDSKIQEGVKAATELGMYVLIDWHVHAENPHTKKSEAKAFFEKYAKMYKDYDNVLFEICNEPTGVNWYNGGSGGDLYSYCKEIATTIRNQGSDALIICGTNTWSQDVDDVAQKPLKNDGFKNILYTFHFYAASHYDDKMQKVRTALAAGTPIFVTEFGICSADGNGTFDIANANAWIKLCDENNMSYACWSLCNKSEAASYLKASCSKKTGGWVESDLATTGVWLVNTYREHQDKEVGQDTTAGNFSVKVSSAASAVEEGYTSTSAGKHTITVTNTGEKTLENFTAALKGNNFSISKKLSKTTLAAGESATLEVTLATGKTAGTYTDTLTVTSGTLSKTCTIKQEVTAHVQTVTGVTLNPASISLVWNDSSKKTGNLTATIATDDNKTYTGSVTWKSSDTTVVAVSGNGKTATLTAKKKGSATITATAGGKSASCTVTVNTKVTGISLSASEISLEKGKTQTLTATCAPSDANNQKVTWKSSNNNVATVDANGKVTAVANGTATITATSEDGGYTATCTVTVTTPVTGVTLDKANLTLYASDTATLNATIEPADASDITVKWTSSNTTVVTISGSGKTATLTAKKKGTATITVTAGGKTATCTVNVIIRVSGVSLSASQLSLEKGKTQTLTATCTPSDAENKAVTWKSSDSNVATIDANGKVTAVANGTAKITATSVDGGYTATCTVTVTTPVTGITLDKTSLSVYTGDTAKLTATIAPADASEVTVTWKSSDATVVSVSGSGKTATLTPKKNGTATITVTAGGKSATCAVTVRTRLTGISLSASQLSLGKGDTKNLTVICTPADASNQKVTWKSSNDNVATVDANGKVTAVAKGEATITATSEEGSYTATCKVKVTTPVTGITLDRTSLSIYAKETAQLTATIEPADASEVTIEWSSSNTNVATVDANGKVTAKGNGTATITAAAGGKTASCTVKVTTKLTGISLSNGKLSLEKGKTQKLTVTYTPSEASEKTVTWESSDSSVATVDTSGNVKAVANGTATITVTSKDGGYKASCEVTVTTPVSSVTLNKTTLSLVIGETGALIPNVLPVDATDKSVSWKSDNTAVATVDAQGMVTAVGAGTTKITVTAGGKTASCTVTVSKKSRDIPANAFISLLTRTANRIEVAVNGADDSLAREYRVNGGAWKDSGVFGSLASYSQYRFEVRYKETDEYAASAVFANATYYTLSADPYSIDLSQIQDSNYISSLYDITGGESKQTVEYDAANKILILTQPDKEYTIKGSAPDVQVKVANGISSVILENAATGGMDLEEVTDITVHITGTNTITATKEDTPGIQMGTSTNLALTGDGSLSVTGGANAPGISRGGKVTIESGTIVIGGGAGASAIVAEEVYLADGSVTVNVGDGAGDSTFAIDVGEDGKISIGNAQVSSNRSNIYSKDPQGTSGEVITMCKITYLDEDGKVIKIADGKKGATIILPEIEAIMGYNRGWKYNGLSYLQKSSLEIKGDMTFTRYTSKVQVVAIVMERDGKTVTNGENITLDKALGQTASIKVTILPEEVLDKSVSWSSADEDVATVKNGKVTPVSVGETLITVAANDGSGVKAIVKITVITSEEEKEEEQEKQESKKEEEKGETSKEKAEDVKEGDGQITVPGELEDDGWDTGDEEIQLKKVSLKKLKAGKKRLQVSWKEVKDADGYQIFVSRNKKFKKVKKVTIRSGSKTKKVIKALKSKKKYFVRVRAWADDNGTLVYGKWSKPKSKKVK